MLEDINDLGGKTPPEAYRFVLNDPTLKLVEAEMNISFIREHLSLYDFFLMMKKLKPCVLCRNIQIKVLCAEIMSVPDKAISFVRINYFWLCTETLLHRNHAFMVFSAEPFFVILIKC